MQKHKLLAVHPVTMRQPVWNASMGQLLVSYHWRAALPLLGPSAAVLPAIRSETRLKYGPW